MPDVGGLIGVVSANKKGLADPNFDTIIFNQGTIPDANKFYSGAVYFEDGEIMNIPSNIKVGQLKAIRLFIGGGICIQYCINYNYPRSIYIRSGYVNINGNMNNWDPWKNIY